MNGRVEIQESHRASLLQWLRKCNLRLLWSHRDPSEARRHHRCQLYTWRLDGVVPYIRVGRSLRYRKSAIDAALVARTFGPGAN